MILCLTTVHIGALINLSCNSEKNFKQNFNLSVTCCRTTTTTTDALYALSCNGGKSINFTVISSKIQISLHEKVPFQTVLWCLR